MKKISGICERCSSFSPFLVKKDDRWLCTVCREEVYNLDRMVDTGFDSF